MTAATAFRIAVLPGDGIGVEVVDACLAVLERLDSAAGICDSPRSRPPPPSAFV